jgi:hypothetical protein
MHSYAKTTPFFLAQNYQSPADWMWGATIDQITKKTPTLNVVFTGVY